MNYSEQILKARFEQLPEGVKEAIIATPWEDKLAQIAGKHRLHIDQADRLDKETIIVMFGLEHPDNLVYNLAKHLEVSEEKAEAIAEDLNNEIFLKIRESLKMVTEGREVDTDSKSSLLTDSLLGKTGEKVMEEEIPSREDILKEIEDKEHHNLPMVNKSELHLEVQLPSEIKVFEKPTDSSIERAYFEETASDIKAEEQQVETSTFINQDESEQEREIFEKVNKNTEQKSAPLHLEVELPSEESTAKTMSGDIFKLKMSGIVNAPKETVDISDSALLPKVKLQDGGKKVDPYRESF